MRVPLETRIRKLDFLRVRSMKKKRATSTTIVSGESNTNRGILNELAERLRHFHKSARALADCLQTRNVIRRTGQSMIEAAKCMFDKLLGEASDVRAECSRRAPVPESVTGHWKRSRSDHYI